MPKNVLKLLIGRYNDLYRQARGPGAPTNAAVLDPLESTMWTVNGLMDLCDPNAEIDDARVPTLWASVSKVALTPSRCDPRTWEGYRKKEDAVRQLALASGFLKT